MFSFLIVIYKEKKAKIWVEEICTPYYQLLMQISVTRYELLNDVLFKNIFLNKRALLKFFWSRN
ncbi:hypothetical protein A2468_01325 [Candidatus Falkowbacteria bacterium RIFOXYC2_FULL_46_15]|nr:MAG: hypothetical protein A2468_01325 [Candidatus Falkowbacteria bacterium RIFOXYC2_FULL_46_15]